MVGIERNPFGALFDGVSSCRRGTTAMTSKRLIRFAAKATSAYGISAASS
jgi:hypothetical protein